MKVKKIVSGVMIVLSLFAVIGAVSAQGASREILFWNGFTGPDRPAVEYLVDQFNKNSTNVKVKMEIMPWDSLYQKLLPALIAGSGPDVIGFSYTRVPEFAAAGRLEPLDDYFKDSALERDVLAPALMEAGIYEGKLYSVPMSFATLAMHYNKDHFKETGLDSEKAPVTIEELSTAWKKLLKVDAAGNVEQYPQAIGVKSTVPVVPVFLWDFGADIVTSTNKSGLASPNAIEAMKFLQNAFVNDRISPVSLTGQEADNLFAAGKASIEWNGPWVINGFRNAGIDLGIAEVPAGPAGRFTYGGENVLVISKDSKVKKEAWKFLEYWNSKEAQKYWTLTVAFPPTRIDMLSDPDIAKNKDLSCFLKGLSYAKPYLPGQTKAARIEEEILVPLYETVFRNLDTVESAMEKANDQLNKLLSEK